MVRQRRARLGLNLGAYALLIVAILIWAFPVLWVFVTSIKPRTEIFTSPPTFIFTPTLEHYRAAFLTRGILESIRNSLIVTAGSTSIAVLVSVPAAYAYARLRFRMRQPLSFYTLFMQMVPPIGLLIPYYLFLNRLKLLNTFFGLVPIYLTITVPFSIWVLVTYFQDLPVELEEAAAIDGASRLQTMLQVVIPQVRGGIGVVTIFSFINSWNEFLYPVVLAGPATQPATVTIFSFLAAEESRWGPFTATACMIMAPVIFVALVAQRNIVQGLSLGSVKG